MWEPAKKFLKTKKVFDRLDEKEQSIKKLQKDFAGYKDFQRQVVQKQLEAELKDVREQLSTARDLGDLDAFAELTIQSKALENQVKNMQAPAPVATDEFQEAMAYVQQELAFINDKSNAFKAAAHKAAEVIEAEIEQTMGHLTIKEKAAILVDKVKKELSIESSKAPAEKPKAPSVLPARTGSTVKSKQTNLVGRLTPHQREAYEAVSQYVKIEDYIEDLKTLGQLK
jgi:hypothetical protein